MNPSPVQAQTTYSNSSLQGTYSFSFRETNWNETANTVTFLGTVSFDGAGNISSGTLTATFWSNQAPPNAQSGAPMTQCSVNATGTYSVSSNASGTATLALADASTASPCPILPAFPIQLPLSLEVAQQGEAVSFQGTFNPAPGPGASDSDLVYTGTGFKQ
jgi:hypothetical protein